MKKWIFQKLAPPRVGAGNWDLKIVKCGIDGDWFGGVMKKKSWKFEKIWICSEI